MNDLINKFVVGVDVSSKFSVITILLPGGETYEKKLHITNDLKGFTMLLNTLEKIEKQFSKRPEIFMESTGLYHIPLYNYFTKSNYNCYIINPICTKNFAKQSVRKVKNDKVDSLRIAQLAQSPTFSTKKTFRNRVPANSVLLAYYNKLIESKPKKVAICALMHKLINHFFAILRDKKPFELRLPETHQRLYLEQHT